MRFTATCSALCHISRSPPCSANWPMLARPAGSCRWASLRLTMHAAARCALSPLPCIVLGTSTCCNGFSRAVLSGCRHPASQQVPAVNSGGVGLGGRPGSGTLCRAPMLLRKAWSCWCTLCDMKRVQLGSTPPPPPWCACCGHCPTCRADEGPAAPAGRRGRHQPLPPSQRCSRPRGGAVGGQP